MPNRLSQSNSPYLLQHQNNPVDWYPWGEEALQRAKAEDKPIFLSIGYAACHWCHVMAHESFENAATAEIMNEHFINIKVDREERPDIDGIYMSAVVALTGSGGWPMSVFLKPDGKPFLGGTYFPPEPRHNLPSFPQLLNHVVRLWAEERGKIAEASEQIAEQMQAMPMPQSEDAELEQANPSQWINRLGSTYDSQNGGWGMAPKFPQAMVIDFLLARASTGEKIALDMAVHALTAMSRGGMYDVIGGGFARYSVDNFWLVPHFEKMLYDNAQLARNYLHAYLITKDERFKTICTDTLDFVIREMRSKEGAFYSSLDADSEGKEGQFYIWRFEEIRSLIPDEDDFQFYSAAFNLSPEGNFEGQIVLQRKYSDSQLSNAFNLSIEDVRERLTMLNAILLDARAKRIRPQTDDKAITSWNAMMMQSFAEAGRYLGREDYTQVAIDNANFIMGQLFRDKRLLRSWREGKADHLAFLEDYAALILGLLALYESDPDAKWYQFAENLTDDMLELFSEEQILFDTGKDHEQLLNRPRDMQDNATPSGNSLAAFALLKMYAFSANGDYHSLAMRNLREMQALISKYPTAFGNWMQAFDFALAGGKEIALIGKFDSKDFQSMHALLWKSYRPHNVVAIAEPSANPDGPPLLRDRPLVGNKASAYVCQQFVCKQPVNSADEFAKLID